ncbi:hypothetical protein AHAS_Ahas07G0083000 [Arachis hypogaea]
MPPLPLQSAASTRNLPPPCTTCHRRARRCLRRVEDILGEHDDIFIEHYYTKQYGNCDLSSMSDPHDEFKEKNVLIERKESINPSDITSKYSMSIETYKDILGECRRKLFEVMSRRARPHLDDKYESQETYASRLLYLGMDWLSHLFSRDSKILLGEAEGIKFYFPVVGTELCFPLYRCVHICS